MRVPAPPSPPAPPTAADLTLIGETACGSRRMRMPAPVAHPGTPAPQHPSTPAP
eukprot:gene412-11197_t